VRRFERGGDRLFSICSCFWLRVFSNVLATLAMPDDIATRRLSPPFHKRGR
jgi:hypothetical protein